MRWREFLDAAKIPILALVILQVVGILLLIVLAFVTSHPSEVVLIIISALSCPVLLYAGYSATKKNKLGLASAALVGAIVGFIPNIVAAGIASTILVLLAAGMMQGDSHGMLYYFILFSIPISGVLWVVFWTVAGAVLGAAGSLIAQKKNSQEKPEASKPKQV
jgi:hypothetical protein